MRFESKLFRTFFLYSLLTLLVTSALLMIFFFKTASVQINRNIYFINLVLKERINNFLSETKRSGREIGSCKDLKYLKDNDPVHRLNAANSLKSGMRQIKDTNPFIKEIRIVDKKGNILLSSEEIPINIDVKEGFNISPDILYSTMRISTNSDKLDVVIISSIEEYLRSFNNIIKENTPEFAYIIKTVNKALLFDKNNKAQIRSIEKTDETHVLINSKTYITSDRFKGQTVIAAVDTKMYNKNRAIIAALLLGMLIVSSLFLLVIAKHTAVYLTKPLINLADVAASVSKDSFRRCEYTNQPIDEIDTLVRSYNIMIDKVQNFTENLEREVKQRTEIIEKQKETLENLNRELEHIAITDKLTGVFNRRKFDDISSREFEIALRSNLYVGIGVIDVDLFKTINDTYGHICGDAALIEVAGCIKTFFQRSSDKIFRYGGDEFIIWTMGDHDYGKDFFERAEKVRAAVENTVIPCRDNRQKIRVTISTGIYFGPASAKENVDELLKEADEMLYKVKEAGRNRVYINHRLRHTVS